MEGAYKLNKLNAGISHIGMNSLSLQAYTRENGKIYITPGIKSKLWPGISKTGMSWLSL